MFRPLRRFRVPATSARAGLGVSHESRRSVLSLSGRFSVGLLATAAVLLGGASSAWAGTGVSVVPSVPANVTVGTTPATSLTIANVSGNGPGETGFETDSFQVTDITLVPSCGSQVFSGDCPAGSQDPGVLVPGATGIGRAGTACAGRTFTITLIDPAQGKYAFTPDAPVVLGPSSGTLAQRQCVIDFTTSVNRVPAVDSTPASPGLQTDQKAFATVTDIMPGTNFGQTGGGIGTARTTVAQATPTITTQASAPTTLGSGQLTDTATLTGLVNPVTGAGAGTVEFRLYGPDDPTCTTVIFTSSNRPLTLNGAQTSGTATSAAFTPTAPGTYRWRAFYSGDANNGPVSGPCNDANESTVVSSATPTITTQASAPTTLGSGQLTDTATLTGLVNPVTGAGAGTVEFRLYGPDDPTCTTVIFTSSNRPLTLNGAQTSGTATSAAFTPTAPGTYRWRAFYSGDANNAPVSGPCNDANESTVVSAPPRRIRPHPRPTEITGLERDRATGTATLTVVTNVGGTLRVARTRKVRADGPIELSEAGSAELQIVPRRRGSRRLRRTGRLNVNPRVIFAAASGGEISERHEFYLRRG